MSKESAQIIEAIQRIAGTFGVEIIQVVDTIVTSDVNEDKLTFGTDAIKGVLLSPVPNDGIILYPANGSTVKIAYSTKTTAFLLQASDLQKARITIGECEYFIDKDGIKLHGDDFGGLVKVNSLVSAYNTVVTDLIAIQTALNTLGQPITITSMAKTAIELENNKVQHGNS